MDPFADSCHDVREIIIHLLFNKKEISYPPETQLETRLQLLPVHRTWYSMQLTCKKWRELTRHLFQKILRDKEMPYVRCIQGDQWDCLIFLRQTLYLDPWKRHAFLILKCMEWNREEMFDYFLEQYPSPLIKVRLGKKIMWDAICSNNLYFVERLWELMGDITGQYPLNICL